MHIEEAIRIITKAIHGEPNSCLSEHASRLSEVLDWLKSGNLAAPPDFVANAPRPAAARNFTVWVTLIGAYTGQNKDEVYNEVMDDLANRDSLEISRIKIHEKEFKP